MLASYSISTIGCVLTVTLIRTHAERSHHKKPTHNKSSGQSNERSHSRNFNDKTDYTVSSAPRGRGRPLRVRPISQEANEDSPQRKVRMAMIDSCKSKYAAIYELIWFRCCCLLRQPFCCINGSRTTGTNSMSSSICII